MLGVGETRRFAGRRIKEEEAAAADAAQKADAVDGRSMRARAERRQHAREDAQQPAIEPPPAP